MSFILDALKKSEIERQRQSEPGLMDAGIRQRRGRLPVWALLLGLLLTINIVVLLIMVMRNGAPASRPTPAAHADALPAAATTGASHFSPLDAAPVYAPEIPAAAATGAPATEDSAAAARPPSPYVAGLRAPASRAAARASRQPDPVLTEDKTNGAGAAVSGGEDNGELLPSISEINLTGAQALPELHLDVHVYATKPSDRFVYINMRKYKEGAILPEGPKIEFIRRDGVVLNFQGLRFLLPRQS